MEQVFFIGNNTYTASQIREIGKSQASIWDAVCLSYRIDDDDESVKFSCVGHGELFETSVEFSELEKYAIA